MDIVACTDSKFIMPIGIMIYSVCCNNNTPVTFHIVIDASVTEKDKKKIESTIEPFAEKQVCFYKIDPHKLIGIAAIKNNRPEITMAAYYRLWLAELLPDNLDKVLYLDGDIIVRQSLLPLWDINLDGYAIAAVPDKYENAMGENNKYLRLHYPPELGYFNSGVLLINLNYWRKENVIQDFVDMIENRPESIKCHDQDVLNYCFREKKIKLPIKYNMQDGFLYAIPEYNFQKYEQEVLEARKNPVIVHYTNGKPWWTYNRHIHPWQSTFFKYQGQTLWKEEPKWEVRPWKIRIRKKIATILRRWNIIPELKPNGEEYIDIAPID